MNKIKIIIIALFVSLYSMEANAIVFMPPVIYISTLSIGSFIANVFAFTAFYMAVNGVVNNLYFGKPMHEIIRLLLSFIGKLTILILSAFIAIKIFDPIDINGMFISSIFAALLSCVFVSFANFRFYRLMREKKRIAIIRSLFFYTIVVFIVTFFSASFATTMEVINTTGDFEKEYVNAGLVPESNNQKSEIKKDESGYQGLYDNRSGAKKYAPQQESQSYNLIKKAIWFFPKNKESCEIYFNGLKVNEATSSQNCFYYKENGEVSRIFCPVDLRLSDLPIQESMIGQEAIIAGNGSCFEEYAVILNRNGFILK